MLGVRLSQRNVTLAGPCLSHWSATIRVRGQIPIESDAIMSRRLYLPVLTTGPREGTQICIGAGKAVAVLSRCTENGER